MYVQSVRVQSDGYAGTVARAHQSAPAVRVRAGAQRIHTPVLAYEIDGKTEGNYVVVTYSCEPATSDELDRVLNLNESIVRTKILRK